MRAWRPSGEDDVRAWLAVRDAVLTAPPVSDPAWTTDGLLGHLTVDPPDEPQVHHAARDGSGRLVGYAVVGLPVEENTDQCAVEVAVHPDARRQGHGTALLRAACATARAAGRRTMVVEVAHDEGRRFAERRGLSVAMRDVSSLLDLAGLDRDELAAVVARGASGYRLVAYTDRTPSGLVESHARARGALADAPTGTLEWAIEAPTPARLVATEEWSEGLRVRTYGVLAVHEQSGEVAAYTDLRVVPWCPRRAEQLDTAVVPEHRGRGLARLVKAANLLVLVDHEPAVRDVETWNGDVNAAMRHVNERLGFRPAVVWEERQAPVSDVLRSVGP